VSGYGHRTASTSHLRGEAQALAFNYERRGRPIFTAAVDGSCVQAEVDSPESRPILARVERLSTCAPRTKWPATIMLPSTLVATQVPTVIASSRAAADFIAGYRAEVTWRALSVELGNTTS
jgi:hypothetical protein